MFESIIALFPFRILSPKHAFWTDSSSVENSQPRSIFFTDGKENIGYRRRTVCGCTMKSTFWPVKYRVVWADVQEFALSWWRMTLSDCFLSFSQTSSKQMVVLHTELTVLQFPTDPNRLSFYHKKTGGESLRSVSLREQLLLGLAPLERPIQSNAVYFRAHKDWSKIRHPCRCYTTSDVPRLHFLSTSLQQSTRAFY